MIVIELGRFKPLTSISDRQRGVIDFPLALFIDWLSSHPSSTSFFLFTSFFFVFLFFLWRCRHPVTCWLALGLARSIADSSGRLPVLSGHWFHSALSSTDIFITSLCSKDIIMTYVLRTSWCKYLCITDIMWYIYI